MNFITKDQLYIHLDQYDIFGFYHKPWYYVFSRLIKWFSGFKVDHVGIVSYVNSLNQDVKAFHLLEQRLTTNTIQTNYFISKWGIDSRFDNKNIILYYSQIKPEIRALFTDDILQELQQYILANINVQYSLKDLLLTNRILFKLFPSYKQKVLKNYENHNDICSGLIAGFIKRLQDSKVLPIDENILIPLPTPIQILTYYQLYNFFIVNK